MGKKEHKLGFDGSCTCGSWGCRRWQDSFPKQGEEKRCPTCLRTLTLRENFDGTVTPWCINCTGSFRADVI